MPEITAVTDADFQSKVLDAEGPVLVDFWASWCGPCRQLAPILEEIAKEKGEALTIVKMDADANPVTPAQYKVIGLPTMNLYYKGEVVKSLTGVRPKAAILGELSEFA